MDRNYLDMIIFTERNIKNQIKISSSKRVDLALLLFMFCFSVVVTKMTLPEEKTED